MSRIFDSLPGVEMPVEAVVETLAHMWDGSPDTGPSPNDFRASQLNLILHFGLETTIEEAQQRFDQAIEFAQRYPCRIVVLCPGEGRVVSSGFEGKLFSQCYIGQHLREVCCCEALILGYSTNQSDFLENQVSIWLESDLPIYHWFHRVPADRIQQFYLGFIERCRRVLFDGEIEGDEYDQIVWPAPNRVRDLTFARSLPERQHLGQFLSGFPMNELVDGLESLRIQYHKGMRRKGFQLLKWHRQALERCFKNPADLDSVVFAFEQLVEEGNHCCLRIDWQYRDGDRYIRWEYDLSLKKGLIRVNLPSLQTEHPLHIEPLEPQKVLAEAMFFG